MRGAGVQLALNFGGDSDAVWPHPVRAALREETVRLVEFAPFPRAQRGQQWHHGFTLDLSPRGLCLRAKEVAAVGSLLRVLLRSVDGKSALDCVTRVAWTEHTPTGAPRMGLAIVASRQSQHAGREVTTPAAQAARIHRPSTAQPVAAPSLMRVRATEEAAGGTSAMAS